MRHPCATHAPGLLSKHPINRHYIEPLEQCKETYFPKIQFFERPPTYEGEDMESETEFNLLCRKAKQSGRHCFPAEGEKQWEARTIHTFRLLREGVPPFRRPFLQSKFNFFISSNSRRQQSLTCRLVVGLVISEQIQAFLDLFG
jgi:hypothetical protein